MVHVKSHNSDVERKMQLAHDVTWSPSPHELPRKIMPPELSLERQWNLYSKTREFCRDDAKHVTASPNLIVYYQFIISTYNIRIATVL